MTHLALFETPLKNFPHLVADRVRILMLQRAHCRFTGVCKAEDRQLLLPGRTPSVAEEVFIYDRIGGLCLGFGVEKVNECIPVVAPDRIPDQTAQAVCPCQPQSFYDVTQYDLGAPCRTQFAVELITAAVVLNKITCLFQFADVMEQRRRLGSQRVGTDGFGGILGKGRHGHGVEKSSGSFTLHPFQQRVVVVAEHHERHISGNVENQLKEEDHHQSQDR